MVKGPKKVDGDWYYLDKRNGKMLTRWQVINGDTFFYEDSGKLVYNNVRLLGEIYICIPKMIDQAKEYGHTEKRELSFLAVHGLLHLLGYDHMNKKDEEIMFGLQELILNEQNIKR